MSDLKSKMESRKREIEGLFKQLEDKRAEFSRQVSAITEEMTRLQGEYRLIQEMENGDDKPSLEIPSKKKKK